MQLDILQPVLEHAIQTASSMSFEMLLLLRCACREAAAYVHFRRLIGRAIRTGPSAFVIMLTLLRPTFSYAASYTIDLRLDPSYMRALLKVIMVDVYQHQPKRELRVMPPEEEPIPPLRNCHRQARSDVADDIEKEDTEGSKIEVRLPNQGIA